MDLMLVCRRWRQIMLDYPQLSTIIPLDHLDVAEMLLNRCGTLPICVYTSRKPLDSYTIREVLNNLSMVIHARISVQTASMLSITPPLPGQALAITPLRSLLLRDRLPPDAPGVLFPDILFSSLVDFTCIGGRIQRYKPMITPSLRKLCLNHVGDITPRNLAISLHGLYNLEELIIYPEKSRTNTQSHLSHCSPSNVALLPNLRVLNIQLEDDSGFLIGDFLQYVKYSTHALIKLSSQQFWARPTTVQELRVILEKIRGEGAIGTAIPVTRLSIEAGCVNYEGSPTGFDIRIKTWGDVPFSTGESEGVPLAELSLFGGMTSGALRFLLLRLDLSRVRQVFLKEMGHQTSRVWPWAAVCRLLLGATEVELSYETWPESASPPWTTCAVPSQFPGLFPFLRVLSLKERNHPCPAPSMSCYTEPGVLELRLLALILSCRKDAGVQVRYQQLKF